MTGKVLFIRFTVRVFRKRLSIVCVLLSRLVLRVDVGFGCISSWSLLYLLLLDLFAVSFLKISVKVKGILSQTATL